MEKTKTFFDKITYNSLPWIERGPGNVAGRVRGLIVDLDDPTGNRHGLLEVLAEEFGKLQMQEIIGQDIAPNLPTLATSALAMAPSNHNVIYAGNR